MHVRCVGSVLHSSVDEGTNTHWSLEMQPSGLHHHLIWAAIGLPEKAGESRRQTAEDGVCKFGCGAAMPRAGPARSVLENGPPRGQERGVGSASERAKEGKEGKEGGKKVQICRTRAGGVGAGPRRGGEPWRAVGVVTSVRAYFWLSA